MALGETTTIYEEIPLIRNEDKPKVVRSAVLTACQVTQAVAWIMEDIIEGKGITCESEICNKGPFHARNIPSISLLDYIARFTHYAKCEEDILIYAMIYLDRIGELIKEFSLDSFSVHK